MDNNYCKSLVFYYESLIFRPNEQVALDPLVLVDALAVIMGHEEKELCKPGNLALMLMVGTATTLLGSKEMVIHSQKCQEKLFK